MVHGFSVASGILAALFWLWSACTWIPDHDDMTIGDQDHGIIDTANAMIKKKTGSPADFMRRQGLLSAIAAIFAAAAAALQIFDKP